VFLKTFHDWIEELFSEAIGPMETSEVGIIEVKANVKPDKSSKNGQSLAESTTMAIMSCGSVLTDGFEIQSEANFVNEAAAFDFGLCDKDTGMVYTYPDAVALAPLLFSTHSSQGGHWIGRHKASGKDGWSKVSFTPKQATTYNIQFNIAGTTKKGSTIERQVIGVVLIVEKEPRTSALLPFIW
jgi:hypothetical protein